MILTLSYSSSNSFTFTSCDKRPTGIEPISTVSKTDALSVMLRTLLVNVDIYVYIRIFTNEETRTLMSG